MAIPGGKGHVEGTGVVDLNSELQRKKWLVQGLVQKQSQSFWAPYKGNSDKSIIFQVQKDFNDNNHVVFDYDGNLTGKPVVGKETAFGKGEQKRKFSDNLKTERLRFTVNNGDKFDGAKIGDNKINEHSDSVSKLGDLWIRVSDQACFDTLQQSAEFTIDLGTDFTLDSILDVGTKIKTGRGFTTTPAGITTRMPLKPFMLANGEEVYLCVIDSFMKQKFLSSRGAQTLLAQMDVRGNNSRLIRGVLGKIDNLLFVEAGTFFGESSGSLLDADGYYNFASTNVEIAGLRQKDGAGKWTGEQGFNDNALTSRALILGQNALQLGISKAPDYKFQASQDFGITSESCLEIWTGVKASKLYDENIDYTMAKVAGYNYGVIGLDCKVK